MSTKKSPTEEKTSSSNLTLKDMVIEAIVVQKEKSGSSLDAIKKFLGSMHQIDTVKQAGRLNRALKKMREEGVVVPGAAPGRKGSGCFKLSAEEKARRGEAAKSASKKLKGVGKTPSAPKKVVKKAGGNAKKDALSSKESGQESR